MESQRRKGIVVVVAFILLVLLPLAYALISVYSKKPADSKAIPSRDTVKRQ